MNPYSFRNQILSLARLPISPPWLYIAAQPLPRIRPDRNVHKLDWGESTEIKTRSGPIRITGLEVAHWGARMIKDDHRGDNANLLERGGHAGSWRIVPGGW